MHYKDNPTGYGGAALDFKLVDGSIDKVVGPYFCTPEDEAKLLKKG